MTIVIRALYVVPLIYLFRVSTDRASDISDTLQHRIIEPIKDHTVNRRLWKKNETTDAETIARFRKSWRRRTADIDYFRTEKMGWQEGTVIVWAGMRGAVTLAAAQTLPRETRQSIAPGFCRVPGRRCIAAHPGLDFALAREEVAPAGREV